MKTNAKDRTYGAAPRALSPRPAATPTARQPAPPGGSNGRGGRSILIIGVTRSIGRLLAEELYHDKRVRRVLGVAHEEEPFYFRGWDRDRFGYHRLNVMRSRDLVNFFGSPGFRAASADTVVHLAFMGDPRTYRIDTHGLNVSGTKAILDRCLATPFIRKFVFLSSGMVYKLGGNTDATLTEDAELNFDPGAHPLIKDAVDAEMICRTRLDHPRCRVVVLRPSGIVGKHTKSELGSMMNSTLCALPFGYNPMVNPVHIRDVVAAIRLSVFSGARGVYNVSGRTIAPMRELLKLSGVGTFPVPSGVLLPVNRWLRTFRLTRYDARINPERLRCSLVLDSGRARKELGFEPRYEIQFR